MELPVESKCIEILKQPGMDSDCNLFVQAVAAAFGKGDFVQGNADAIWANMKSAPFNIIGEHPALATLRASEGKLVLGALSKSQMTYTSKSGMLHVATMGHVVVVVPGGPSKPTVVTLADGKSQPCRGGYPYCYQGAHNIQFRFRARTQVDAVFPSTVLNEVFYAYLEV